MARAGVLHTRMEDPYAVWGSLGNVPFWTFFGGCTGSVTGNFCKGQEWLILRLYCVFDGFHWYWCTKLCVQKLLMEHGALQMFLIGSCISHGIFVKDNMPQGPHVPMERLLNYLPKYVATRAAGEPIEAAHVIQVWLFEVK